MVIKWVAAALAAALLLAAGFGVWKLFKKSELDLVKGRVAELAEKCAKAGDEGPITSAGNAQAIAKLFADGCSLELDQPPLSGNYRQEDVASHAMLVRNFFKSVAFSVHDLEASLTTKLTAKAKFTLYLGGSLQGGESVKEARDIEAMLVKANGQWLFSEVKVANPVRK